MIRCGWCGKGTANPDRCTSCGHEDPARPWVQRGQLVPVIAHDAGRPANDPASLARRLAAASRSLVEAGRSPTVEALAEVLDISPRTVRRWRRMSG